jgi:hypothetical protein
VERTVADRRGPRRRLPTASLIGIALIVAGGWLALSNPGWPAAFSSATSQIVSTQALPTEPSTAPPTQAAARSVSGPLRLRFRALGIDAAVVPIRTTGRVLTPPADPSRLGWWHEGARPGAAAGTLLVTGHTVHDGVGVLDDLGRALVGDRVSVSGGGHRITYGVTRVLVLTKAQLARRAPGLFDVHGPHRLVLVTCESWDGAGYDGNVVVVAEPIR